MNRAALVALALATLAALLGIWKGSFVAGASDAYGYVSQADLLAHGRLSADQQFVRTLPWPFADWSFAPAGYRPATWRGAIVPTYPIGVPMLMALFERIGGRNAVFYVVPLLGGVCVWMTALLGLRVHREATGLAAAVLVATSPSFLVELMAPASDVAATAWWTTALVGALGESGASAAASGLAAAFAVLTRPNLVLLDVVIAGFLFGETRRVDVDRRHAATRLAIFVTAAGLGCAGVAIVNTHLYGSPFRSGYESLDALFQWRNAAANLDRYPRWLVQSQTPFIMLGFVAPWVVRWRRDALAGVNQRGMWLLLAFVATVCGSYIFYRPFGRDEWTYLRFLLPAYPALLVLAVAATFEVAARVAPEPKRAATIAASICAVVALWQARESIRRGAFAVRDVERRYVDVAHYVETMLPLNTVCIARLHAGSIRYYANRLTVYYDSLQPAWLDTALNELAARGYHPLIVVEEAEETGFRERFAGGNTYGKLDWPPASELTSPVDVRIYDPADRDRFRRGEPMTPRRIFPWARFR